MISKLIKPNYKYQLMPTTDRNKLHCVFCGSKFTKYYYLNEKTGKLDLPSCCKCILLKSVLSDK